jgi:hypothetical protein
MGRGRAKAKQTKVARELKYHTPTTDLDSLQRELGSPSTIGASSTAREDSDDDDLDDRWATRSG